MNRPGIRSWPAAPGGDFLEPAEGGRIRGHMERKNIKEIL